MSDLRKTPRPKGAVVLALCIGLCSLCCPVQSADPSARIIDEDDNYWNARIGLADGAVVSAADAQLFRVYYGALGRLPDAGGFLWWSTEIAEGRRNLQTMAAGFIRSPEFRSLADSDRDGSLSNHEFLIHMYVTVFGREPDPGGYQWWKAELDSGRRSKTSVLVGMTQSNEYVLQTLDVAAQYLRAEAELRLADPAFWTEAAAIARRDAYRIGRPTADRMYLRLPDAQNCDPGELTDWAKQNALRALNALRELHDLPPVSYLASFDSEVQSAALVQLANAGIVGHRPSPSVRCYSQLAYDGASSSNLAFASFDRHPISRILSWANDAGNLSTLMAVGHRRHMLKPDLGYLSYGATLGMTAQKVFNFGRAARDDNVDAEFVAFPYGAYPYILLSEDAVRPTPWSFHRVTAAAWDPPHDYFSTASVAVVDSVTGRSLAIEDLYRDNDRGYGRLRGALSWIVPAFDYDRRYDVTISGVSLPTGELRDYRYPVRLLRRDILDLNEPLEATDRPLPRGIAGSIGGPEDRDSNEVHIDRASTLRVVGDSLYLNWAFVVEIYDEDKRLLLSTDEEREVSLEAGTYTVAVGRCSSDGWCYGWNSLTYRVELL